uniref:FBD domain-containing protein n=1 Tax=Chenopodium quinoa TaxID=63459 RepID=A0A803KVC9_CHEQI
MDLTIHAPKLRNLRVRGFIYSLFLEDTRVINTVVLEIWLRNYGCLDDIFDCLANVEVLVLNDSFWLSTYHYKPPKKFPKGLGRLRTLILAYVRLYEQAHMSFVLCLLASSPRLEKLSIQVPQFAEVTDDQPVQIDCSNIFQCLRKVQLLGMLGLRSELQLIQYILAQSPVLEEMTIGLNEITSQMGSEVKYCFSLEAMLCPRASPNAEIIITTVC